MKRDGAGRSGTGYKIMCLVMEKPAVCVGEVRGLGQMDFPYRRVC